jgi:hypothetical protein
MEPLIYYPSLEPPDDTWLKFALIYFEKFRPIVPYSRRHLLSDNFRRICQSTDLIELYEPNYEVGERASLAAKEEAEKMLTLDPERRRLFGQESTIRRWRDQANWGTQIFHEKFSDNWGNFCLSNKIGIRNDDGILLPEELAFLFMTFLAKEVAFEENAAIVTDNVRYDNFTNFTRVINPTQGARMRFAQGIINLLIPQNLSQISFKQLIEFRNRNRERIRAFNTELDIVQQRIGQGFTSQNFIDSYNRVYSEFSKEVILQGLGVAAIPFTAYILLENPHATSPEYMKETLGALGVVLVGGYSLNRMFKDNQTRRYCKKYLTNLERLR